MANSIFKGNTSGIDNQRKLLADRIVLQSLNANKKNSRAIDISKIEEDTIPLLDGSTVTIKPAELAKQCQFILDKMKTNSRTAWSRPFIDKPVIWTYEVDTAATDGNRIFFNPLFAYMLRARGNSDFKLWKKTLPDEADKFAKLQSSDPASYTALLNDKIFKYFKYVLIHEIYHMLYSHLRREAFLLGEKMYEPDEHSIANIAQDAEINRDIEGCYAELRGCTESIGGIWYKNQDICGDNDFKRNIWEDIYKYLKSSGYTPKQHNDIDPDANPTANSSQDTYKKGWNRAFDAVENDEIDPDTFLNI